MALLLSVALTGGTLACSSSEDGSPQTPAPAVAGQEPGLYGAVLAEDQRRLLFDARERLIGQCMAERGFEYLRSTFVATPDEILLGRRRWGPLAAGDTGYQGNAAISALEAASAQVDQDRQAFLGSMSPEERSSFYEALLGVDLDALDRPLEPRFIDVDGQSVEVSTAALEGSCQAQTDAALYGSADDGLRERALYDYLSDVQDAVDRRAASDSDFVTAVREWSECFADEGFQAADPLEAAERYSTPGGHPDEAELRAVQADVACKASTNLWERWQGALAAAWAARDGEERQLLQELVELRAAAVQRAQAT